MSRQCRAGLLLAPGSCWVVGLALPTPPTRVHARTSPPRRASPHATLPRRPPTPAPQVQVCHTRKFGVSASRNVFQRAAAAAQPTELATPVMLPIPDLHGYSSRRWGLGERRGTPRV